MKTFRLLSLFTLIFIGFGAHPAQATQKVYLFLPGYYGSTLYEKDSHDLVWGNPWQILLGSKTLAMKIPGMEIPGALNLQAGDLIEGVKILGGLMSEDAYQVTMDMLRGLCKGHADCSVEGVAWDWRQEPMEGARALDDKVQALKKKYVNPQIMVLSHSYGSLVVSYYLRYGIQDYFSAKENWAGLKEFSKVVMVAAPFRGTMALMRNMHKGLKIGLNGNMQSPLSFCTLDSSFFMLPPPGLDTVKNENMEILSLGIYAAKNWWNNHWGIFQDSLNLPDSSLPARKEFISKVLARAQKWHELMDAPMKTPPGMKVPILYLRAKGKPTVHEGIWLQHAEQKNIFLYYEKDFRQWMPEYSEKIVFGDGDGTIPDFSGKLPAAFLALNPKPEEIYKDAGHLEILQAKDSQEKIRQFLLK